MGGMSYDSTGLCHRTCHFVAERASGNKALDCLAAEAPNSANLTPTKVAIVASLAVLVGLFSAKGMIGAPAKSAAAPPSVDVGEIARTLPGNLLLFEDTHQRQYGVLDTLKE